MSKHKPFSILRDAMILRRAKEIAWDSLTNEERNTALTKASEESKTGAKEILDRLSEETQPKQCKVKVQYWVEYGDWEVIDTDEIINDPGHIYHGWPKTAPSKEKADDRTITSKPFDTLEEAKTYAINLIQKADIEWLAYVKIVKEVAETVKEYDIERLKMLK